MFLRFDQLRRAGAVKWTAIILTGIMLFGLLPVNICLAESAEPVAGPKLVMVLGSDGCISGLTEAYQELLRRGYKFQLKLFSSTGLSAPETVEQMKNEGSAADVVLFEMVGSSNLTTVQSVAGEIYAANRTVILSTQSAAFENVDDSQDAYLSQYFTNGTKENMRRLELYLLSKYCGVTVNSEECSPVPVTGMFIYHPDAVNSDSAGSDSVVAGAVYESVAGSTYISGDQPDEGTGKPAMDKSTSELSLDDSAGKLAMDDSAGEDAMDDSEPVPFPGTFSSIDKYLDWYQKAGKMKENAPTIGIIAFDTAFKNEDIEMYTQLQKSLEAKGANTILVFSSSGNKKAAVEQYFMQENGRSRIDLLVAAVGFNFIYGSSEGAVELFKRLNVPVLAPVYSSDLKDWENNPAGISSEVAWQIAYPELDGRIEPVLLGGSKVVSIDPYTGASITKNVPLPDRIERASGRILSWANLRRKPNQDKKVALIYYNPDGGKDGISASYLNVTQSVYEILGAMQSEGYLVEGEISPEALNKTMLAKGRNIGSWAPGELDSLVKAGAMTIPVDKYLEWYQTLPQTLRDQVEKEWGPPPGNIMVHNGQLVIPGAMLGKIFIGPQPMRGWADDPDKIAHSPSLPPPHQYIAFYLWLQKEYGADAVIHLGTHGTLEWLPGRSVGLGEADWPDALIGNMPDIYPYIVNNPGEATQAKRRGYAVTIGHLTPPLIKPKLYGSLAELQTLITDYQSELSNETSSRLTALQQEITKKIKDAGLDQVLEINLNEADFSQVIPTVEKYLEDLTMELMPYGLHTFGVAPEGELLDQMTDSIVDYDRDARESSREQIRNSLALSTNEMTNLLRALGGEYIEPGLGRDPVRVPEAMPTGRNLISFDPRMVPDRAAWETGKKVADQLLEKYKAEKGCYPETVGVVLWAVETMRTQGESVAMILRLIGAEPVWDSSGKVSKVKITPLEELGRPRIDVVVTISGLFRDTFANCINILDDAFRQIALLDENSDDNLVKKHSRDLKATLIAAGMSEEDAGYLASARIFGDAPGTYGTGVSELTKATSAWGVQQDLADVYVSRMSYMYGRNSYGQQATETFQQLLKNVDTVVQVRDSVWGTLDNDDVFQYLGGLKLAAEAASGKEVEVYIANTRNAANPTVQTFGQFLATELSTRILNPEWINGMLNEGFAGSTEIAKEIANLFGVDSTLGAVDDWAWKEVAETLILDKTISGKLDPYALQSIIGWNMEAARREMWDADPETLSKLADLYIQTAVDYGVVCCHHTCKNLVFNEWMAQASTLDDSVLTQYQQIFAEATGETINIPTRNSDQITNDSDQNTSDHDSDRTSTNDYDLAQTSANSLPAPSTSQKSISGSLQSQAVAGPARGTEVPGSGAPGAGTRGAGAEQAPPQSAAASATAGSTSAGSDGQTEQSAAKTGKPDNTAGTGRNGGQKGYSAYEINPEDSRQKGSGVTMWAILSVFAVMLALAFGIAKGKRLSS